MKYKEMLKRKGSKDSGLVPVKNQIKLGLSKKQMRIYGMS